MQFIVFNPVKTISWSPVVSLSLFSGARGDGKEESERETNSLLPSHHPLLPPCALREDDWGRVNDASHSPSFLKHEKFKNFGLHLN